MSRGKRERVNSPDELRAGDRVEVDDTGGSEGFATVVDLLYRTGAWRGLVISVPRGAWGLTADGLVAPVTVGALVCIDEDAYALGLVFIRRRSREDQHHHQLETQGA